MPRRRNLKRAREPDPPYKDQGPDQDADQEDEDEDGDDTEARTSEPSSKIAKVGTETSPKRSQAATKKNTDNAKAKTQAKEETNTSTSSRSLDAASKRNKNRQHRLEAAAKRKETASARKIVQEQEKQHQAALDSVRAGLPAAFQAFSDACEAAKPFETNMQTAFSNRRAIENEISILTQRIATPIGLDADPHVLEGLRGDLRAKEGHLIPAQAAERDAEAQAQRWVDVALERKARWQADVAVLGHPGAMEEGGWSDFGLEGDRREIFFTKLEGEIHEAKVLDEAKYSVNFRRAPVHNPAWAPGARKKRAVVLDCEMVGNETNKDILAQLCVVDMLTGEVLLDILMEDPSVTISDYRTKWSGITRSTYDYYRERGLTLPSLTAVQDKLFEIIDQQTVLVGWALRNDMNILDITHNRIVDAQIVIQKGIGKRYRNDTVWPSRLKTVCAELLKRDVQKSTVFGHDCVEDCFAPREVLIWWLDPKNEVVKREWIEGKAGNPLNYKFPGGIKSKGEWEAFTDVSAPSAY